MAFDKHMILRTVLILVAAVVLFALISYYNTKQASVSSEKFLEDQVENKIRVRSPNVVAEDMTLPTPSMKAMPTPSTNAVQPADDDEIANFRPIDYEVKQVPNDCFPKDRLTSEDLLPSDASSKWAQVNPSGQGDVKNVNFLTAGFHVGINTTSGSMKNANLQIRSEPPNPKGSWPIMNSSYSPSDLLRRPLEIGGDCA
jgi:hypothetical protein